MVGILGLSISFSQAKLSLGKLATTDLGLHTDERPSLLGSLDTQVSPHDPWDDYYNDDDFYFSRRLRRFHTANARTYGWNYYDPYYVDDLYYVMGTPLWNRFYAPRPIGFNRGFFRTRSFFWGFGPRVSLNFNFGWGGWNSWAYDPFFCPPVWNRPAALGWYGPTYGGWGFNRGFGWGWNRFNRGFNRGYNAGFYDGYNTGVATTQNYWYRRSAYNRQLSGNYAGTEAVFANYKRLPNAGVRGSRNMRNNPYVVDQYERRGGNRSSLNSRRSPNGTVSSRSSRTVRTPSGVSRTTRTTTRTSPSRSSRSTTITRNGTSPSRVTTRPRTNSHRSTATTRERSSSSVPSYRRSSSSSRSSTLNRNSSSSSRSSTLNRSSSSSSRRSSSGLNRSSSSSRSSMSRPSSSPSRRSSSSMNRSSSSSRSSDRPSSSFE